MVVTLDEAIEHYDRLIDKCAFNGATFGFMDRAENKSLAQVIRRYIPNYKNDKDYRAIVKFRDWMDIAEFREHKQSLIKLNELLEKLPQSKEFKAARLREMGLEIPDVCGALHISPDWYGNHVRKLVDKNVNQGYDLEGAIFDISNRMEEHYSDED